MGQVEVLQVLEKSKVPLSAHEIADEMKERLDKICRILTALEKFNEVQFFELNKNLAMKFFKAKRRMKLYYVP